MKKVVLLGSTGFIGSNIKENLQEKGSYELYEPSIDECNLLQETSVRTYLSKLQPDFIINAAFLGVDSSIRYSDEYVVQNIQLISNVLKGCQEVPKLQKIIHFGSGLEYGNSEEPISEASTLNPKSTYATVKAVTSLLFMDIARNYSIPSLILKPFNLFGKYDTKSFIHYVINSTLHGQPLTITRGEQLRDYLYIKDLAEMVERILQNADKIPNNEVYNIASGKSVKLSQMFTTIFEILKSKSEITYKEYPANETFFQQATITKLSAIIDIPPLTPLEQALQETITWEQSMSAR